MAITFNIRQFMLGRYDVAAEWRVHFTALLVFIVIGLIIATFTSLRWRVFIWLGVVIVVAFAIPLVSRAAISLPPAYVTAANMEIVSGTVTQEALPRLAFIAREGEELSLRIAEDASVSEDALAAVSGFADKTANSLRNTAGNRIAAIERQSELEEMLAGNLLTPNQRDVYTTEYERLEIPEETALDTYSLNQLPVSVRVLRGATGDVIGEVTLEPDSDAYEVTLPDDGWYVLEKTIAGEQDSAAVLEVFGLYPILERSFLLSETVGPDGEVIPARRVNQYLRMTDAFLTEETRPSVDDEEVPFAIIIDNQYRGARSFATYLRLYLSPFLSQIVPGMLQALLAVLLGFVAAKGADRLLSPADKPKQTSNRVTTWSLIALPAVAFILIYGVGNILPITDTRNWGGLLLTMMLTMVGIIGAFPLGVTLALGRRSDLPVIKYVSTLYIEAVRGVPLITVLFMAQLLVPFLNPALADVDNVFRAMVGITLFSAAYLAENVRGGLQAIPPGQVEAARALGLSGLQITLLITLPQALRAVIPALVGQFISLFKDTSLVAIVGLIDLTGISNSVVAQTEFIGLRREAFFFITIIYFVFSYVMSWASRRIEETGSGSVRRG
jgi:His/Glu/Gln/Arg/opine family amino acid ABC transporter permease subunit